MKLIEASFKPRTRKPVKSHQHLVYEWHYVAAGNALITVENIDYPIKAGEFFYIKPNQPHNIAFKQKDHWLLQIIFHVMMETKEDKVILNKWSQKFNNHWKTLLSQTWQEKFNSIANNFKTLNPLLQKAASLDFESILLKLIALEKEDLSPNYPTKIKKAIEFIQKNKHHALSLDEIANHIHLEKSYFIRLFKQHTGQSPFQFYLSEKMLWAANQLNNTNHSIQSIAEDCGFPDPFHFSKRFKTWAGLSPQQYRKKHLKNNQ